MMTFLMDDDWKNVRSVVTASFTSGKLKEVFKNELQKIKAINKLIDLIKMSKLMIKYTEIFDKYLENLVEDKDGILDAKK